jgi:adenylate kinase family enzyme
MRRQAGDEAIVAVAGPIGAGKTTLCRALSAALGWPVAGFGDFLRVEAHRRERPSDRATLQRLGDQLIADWGWPAFTHAVIGQVNGPRLIVDGIRHAQALDALEDAKPDELLVVYVSTPIDVRRARGAADDDEQHSSEGHLDTLYNRADLVCDGTALDQSVSAVLARLGPLATR